MRSHKAGGRSDLPQVLAGLGCDQCLTHPGKNVYTAEWNLWHEPGHKAAKVQKLEESRLVSMTLERSFESQGSAVSISPQEV